MNNLPLSILSWSFSFVDFLSFPQIRLVSKRFKEGADLLYDQKLIEYGWQMLQNMEHISEYRSPYNASIYFRHYAVVWMKSIGNNRGTNDPDIELTFPDGTIIQTFSNFQNAKQQLGEDAQMLDKNMMNRGELVILDQTCIGLEGHCLKVGGTVYFVKEHPDTASDEPRSKKSKYFFDVC